MKFEVEHDQVALRESRPMRGAWIEIPFSRRFYRCKLSRPMRGAWIEIIMAAVLDVWLMSRPMRGAWIEIIGRNGCNAEALVAPHAGRVD